MWRLCACAVAVVLLGGCSSTFFFLPDTSEPAPAPTDYQQIVAKDMAPMKARLGMGALEISPVRPTRLAQPGDWFACVRTNIQERKVHYAIFMRDGKVTDRREAVVIDGCPQQDFQPLPVVEATPAAAPATAASSAQDAAPTGAAPTGAAPAGAAPAGAAAMPDESTSAKTMPKAKP
jgi:hypothetical protein